MKLKAYNRSKDEVVIIDSHGNVSERGIKRFIRSGQDNDLPPEDREVLLQQLEGRTDIIADKGLNGGHCFSLPGDQPLLNYLWGGIHWHHYPLPCFIPDSLWLVWR